MGLLSGANKILFLGAHPDDEISCAGTLHKLANRPDVGNIDLRAMFFSPCLESMPKSESGHPNLTLWTENAKSLEEIGIDEKNVQRFDFPVRRFPEFRQQILQQLIDYKNGIDGSPIDLVIMPSLNSRHQDHRVVAEEAVRAFPYATLLSWNFYTHESVGLIHYPPAYVRLTRAEAQVAALCMMRYKSQEHRLYMFNPLMLLKALEMNGLKSGNPGGYAEKFEVVRLSL